MGTGLAEPNSSRSQEVFGLKDDKSVERQILTSEQGALLIVLVFVR